MPRFFATALVAAASLAAMPLASADDSLPGVKHGAGTVTTDILIGEPEDGVPVGSTPGSYKVGNWDVTISGSVSYQIGFGGYRHDGRSSPVVNPQQPGPNASISR